MTTSLEDRLRNDLTAAAAGVRVAPAPPFDQLSPARGRRSRRALVGGLAAGLTLVALPAAAATGALSSVTEAFGWSHQPGVIEAADATGQLLLTMTGPGGEPMQLYSPPASTAAAACPCCCRRRRVRHAWPMPNARRAKGSEKRRRCR